MQTHTVFNQASSLINYDMFKTDSVLHDLVQRYGASWANKILSEFGQFAGSEHGIALARQANENEPVLQNWDRFGNRIDRVEFHPAYHELMAKSIEFGIHSLPWDKAQDGAHVARAAMMYMSFQNEAGHCCPISMTYSVIPSLRRQPELSQLWEPLIRSRTYDSRYLPWSQKTGLTMGMAMTEKQGGSDVRANTTKAIPVEQSGPGKEYRLTGHKWFCSAPMSDAFLMLAQTDKGLSCFLVPRFELDGSRNKILVQRLKDKLGNKSNASSEIELEGALGWLVGEEGRGVPTIIEMVNHTRLDCIIGAAALMRQSTLQALHHCHQRSAFGKVLSEQPLMMNVLADLSIESEAAARMMMRVASAYDKFEDSESEKLFKRVGSAIAKYWVCKRAPMHVAEALESLGGNGYVEAGPMPRLFRESPLLGIWEGSGNVICLDVLRAVAKEPETLDAFANELEASAGLCSTLDAHIRGAKDEIASIKKAFGKKNAAQIEANELSARRFVERLALALQASLMVRQAPDFAANAFVSSRLARQSGFAFGTLDCKGSDLKAIVSRSYSV